MITRIIVLLGLLIPLFARAANPAFGDFNLNQFQTNGNKVAIKSGALLTNITVKVNLNLPSLTPSTPLGLDADGNVTNVTVTGAPSGTVVNSGTSAANVIPVYSDGTGTNITPSKVTITSGTNLLTGTLLATNSITIAGIPVKTNVIGAIGLTLDGQGLAITTGVKGYVSIPAGCTIQSVTMLADQSGSAVVDIWKCTYSQFDAGSTHPVAGDKITASAPPTITATYKSQDTTLTGWTTSISANDVLAFSVTSCSTITRLNLILKVNL